MKHASKCPSPKIDLDHKEIVSLVYLKKDLRMVAGGLQNPGLC